MAQVSVGSKVSCTVSFFNPLPFEISATLQLSLSGGVQSESSAQPLTIAARANKTAQGTFQGVFENVAAPQITTLGKAIIIANVNSPFLNTVRDAFEIEVVEAKPAKPNDVPASQPAAGTGDNKPTAGAPQALQPQPSPLPKNAF